MANIVLESIGPASFVIIDIKMAKTEKERRVICQFIAEDEYVMLTQV